MAAEITKRYQLKPELIASRGGAFEIFVNGKKIYSKLETGSFPNQTALFRELDKA